MKLEVACFNLESVAVVAQSQADRIEFDNTVRELLNTTWVHISMRVPLLV